MTELTCFKAYDIRGEIGVNIDDDTSETSPTFILTALMAFLRGYQRSRNYLAEQSHKISDFLRLWEVLQEFSDAVKKKI